MSSVFNLIELFSSVNGVPFSLNLGEICAKKGKHNSGMELQPLHSVTNEEQKVGVQTQHRRSEHLLPELCPNLFDYVNAIT